ncbi:MAG: hypothetical protein IAF58_00880 [Leptolyngbya sp.]|nr:hypothetical protein [Candidatus Melainabacteria bacterium]
MLEWFKRNLEQLQTSLKSEEEKEFWHAQNKLVERKQKHLQLTADEMLIQDKLVRVHTSKEKRAALLTELELVRENKRISEKLLSDIEFELKKAYTRKEIFLAQRKSQLEPKILSRELKIVLALVIIWQLIGLILKLRPMF